MSRGDQGRNRGRVDRSVERDDEFFDASTEFDDTSRFRVARKQARVEQSNSVTGRSAMAPSKNSSSTDRRPRNRGEHGTVECPNSSFRGVDSGGTRSDRTVERPNRGEDRRRRPRRGRRRGMVAGFHRVVVEIIPMMIILGSRTTVHRARMMTTSWFPVCRDRGSKCRSSMEVSLGRAGGHTSKTALRTIVGVNATKWRS